MKLAIAGASGHMGRAVSELIAKEKSFELVGALRRDDDTTQALNAAEAIIDFSSPDFSISLAKFAAAEGVIHIIGTTGFSPEQEKTIEYAAKKTVIVKSGNMSLGVNLLATLVNQAASSLGSDFDIEILEMHHRNKIDAPSGTALLLGNAAAQARSERLQPKHDRSGKRSKGIGFASLRGGSVIGEHDVIFAGPSERLVLSHKAEDRSIFARGALRAALWAKGKPPGLYSMQDVLGLNS